MIEDLQRKLLQRLFRLPDQLLSPKRRELKPMGTVRLLARVMRHVSVLICTEEILLL